jgi:hypothetical protein
MPNNFYRWLVGLVLCTFFLGLPVAYAEEILLGEANPYSATTFNLNPNWIRASRASAVQDGDADHLAVYFHQAGQGLRGRMALYTDDGQSNSAPKTLLAQTAESAIVSGWNYMPLPRVSLRAGNVYWIGIMATGATLAKSGAITISATSGWKANNSFGYAAFPSSFPAINEVYDHRLAAYAYSSIPTKMRIGLMRNAFYPLRGELLEARLDLSQPATIRVMVYNNAGEAMQEALERNFPAGLHTIQVWDGRSRGSAASAGLYHLVFETGGERVQRKVVVVR